MAPDDYGYIKISRRAYATCPFWNEHRVFSQWEAWEDMIQEASFADRSFAIPGGAVIALIRGETRPMSRSFLATRWGWTDKRVRNFLQRLLKMGRIGARQGTPKGPTYLLVNYELYQGQGPAEGHEEGQQRARQGPGEGQNKKTGKEVKKGKDDVGSWLAPFGDLWRERCGGEPSFARLGRVIKGLRKEHTDAEILAHWDYYLRENDPSFVSAERFGQTFGRWQPGQDKPASIQGFDEGDFFKAEA